MDADEGTRDVRPTRAAIATLVAGSLLAGCGGDGPPRTWAAVDESLCSALDVAGTVAATYPDLSGTPSAVASEDDLDSSATCEVTLGTSGLGRTVSVVVQVTVRVEDADPGPTYDAYLDLDLDDYGPPGHPSRATEDEATDGWWDEGRHRAVTWASSESGGYVAIDVLLHDNLAAEVIVIDQGQTIADQVDAADVGRRLATDLSDGLEAALERA